MEGVLRSLEGIVTGKTMPELIEDGACLLEVRQDIFPAPTLAAGCSPSVVVSLGTPDDEGAIDPATLGS